MFVLNAPGIIDSSYLDEIKVILVNSGDSYINIKKGHRIAQLIIERLPLIDLVEVKEFTNTSDRGGGLGSTGK
jgi:dUTP pyrophosphatase